MKRRSFLCGISAFAAAPAIAHRRSIDAVLDYETASGGHVGLYAANLRTGKRLEWRAHERFVMCSTFKASLAALVLFQVDRGQARLHDVIPYSADVHDWHAPVAKANLARGALSVGEMCEAAVEDSDNTCANILLARIGGPAALTAFWRQLGDEASRLDDPEPYLNRTPPGGLRNTTTPTSMTYILRQLVLGGTLSSTSRAALQGWLVGCNTGAHRLRAGLPKTWTIANETGNNGMDAAGDIAIVWAQPAVPIVIGVYTRGGAPTEQQLTDMFAGIGRAMAEQLA